MENVRVDESFDDIFKPNQSVPGRNFQNEDEFDKDAWAEKKKKQRENVFALIDEGAEQIASGEIIQDYLLTQARFPRYSANNAILITMQQDSERPATLLRDYDGWRDAGYFVQKNPESFEILEPGKEYERQDGTMATGVNVKRVFDISQTNARPQYKEPKPIRSLLKAMMHNAPCKFALTDELPEGTNISYSQQNNTVFVRRGLDGATMFRGIAQGLAKAIVDRSNRRTVNASFVSYCVAYMQYKANGFSTDNFNFDRLPEEFQEMDSKGIREELSVIAGVNREITEDITRYFEIQERNSRSQEQGAR